MSTIEVKLDEIDKRIAMLEALQSDGVRCVKPTSSGAGNVHDHYQAFLTAFDSIETAIDDLIKATTTRLATIRQSFETMDSAVADAMLTNSR